jgi:hypothetical protein
MIGTSFKETTAASPPSPPTNLFKTAPAKTFWSDKNTSPVKSDNIFGEDELKIKRPLPPSKLPVATSIFARAIGATAAAAAKEDAKAQSGFRFEKIAATETAGAAPGTSVFGVSSGDKGVPAAERNVFSKPVQGDAALSALYQKETAKLFSKPAAGLFSKSGKGNIFAASQSKEETSEEATTRDPLVSPGRQDFITQASTEEIKAIKTILCDQVPSVLLKKHILQKHFSKFGTVSRVLVNTRKMSATVTFDDHKSAKKAKERGQNVNPRVPSIGLIHYLKKRRSSESGSAAAAGRRYPSQPEEVDEELAAMSGAASGARHAFDPFGGGGGGGLPEKKKKAITIDEKAISSLPLKKRLDRTRPPRMVGALKTKVEKKKPSYAAVEQEAAEIVSKPVNEKDLLEIMRKAAHNDQEKFDVLEARDKLMKSKGLHRQSTVLVGTCPDICPEKERYSRSAKNQLRTYEKINALDEVNHKAVVKEYSRSSADQDVPLSHEMRPQGALSQAMTHLLCNVVDRVESATSSSTVDECYDALMSGRAPRASDHKENIGEWFEYIWSTTRGLRKDITQQQLTDLVAVNIVEQCTRFHIMCAERLVEEDSHNFASKLNDENLTKCLQTLKHMYEDLRLESVVCPNESEFRAYEILMNLNDGDTLRGVQTLDRRVRERSDIMFSLDVFTAINSKNYIRFFRLVRKSTLTQGCILVRYFYQVRKRALETIARAYCPNLKTVVPYSLTKLTYMLAFEDIQECGLFCRLHGLNFDVNSDVVYLDRSAFYLPDEIPVLSRARNLIESKRNVAWSEVLNGGQLPENPYPTYVPHNSFDANGYLRPEAYEARDQQVVREVVQTSPEELERRRLVAERKREVEAAAHDVGEELIQNLVAAEVKGAAEKAVRDLKIEAEAKEVSEELCEDTAKELLVAVAKEVIREAKNEELSKRLLHESKMIAAEDVLEDLVFEVANEMMAAIAKDEMSEVEINRKLKKYLALANDVVEDLCKDEVKRQVKSIVEMVLDEEERQREEAISLCVARRELRMQLSFFRAWQKYARKQSMQRKIMDDFTSGPAALTCKEQLDKLGGLGNPEPRALSHTLKIRSDVDTMFRAVVAEDNLFQKLILEPLDLVTMVRSALSKGSQNGANDLWWKCLLCLPTLPEESDFGGMSKMLRKKFNRRHAKTDDQPNLLSCFSTARGGKTVSICVRMVDTDVLQEEIIMSEKKRKEYLSGTMGILFGHFEGEDEDAADAAKRLRDLVQNLPRQHRVPLAILSTALEKEDVVEDLQLDALVEEEKIGSFEISLISPDIFDPSVFLTISNVVNWLAQNSPTATTKGMAVKNIRDYVEDFICANVLTEFYANLKERLWKGLCHQNPNTLIGLYNSALEHLETAILNQSLSEISWPIPELPSSYEKLPSYWNDAMYLDIAAQTIRALALPTMVLPDVALASWPEHMDLVFDYFSQIQRSYGEDGEHVMRLRKHLRKAHRAYERKGLTLDRDEVMGDPAWQLLPWTDMVHAFIDYKLSLMATVDQYSPEKMPIVLGYFESDLESFRLPREYRRMVGSKPEDSSLTFSSCLDQSVIRRESSVRDDAKEKKRKISVFDRERDDSAIFEERLKSAISGSHSPRQPTNPYVRLNERNVTAELSRPYEPVIACLSPSLAKLANSRSLWTKTDLFGGHDSEMEDVSLSSTNKKRKASFMTDLLPPTPATIDIVTTLRDQIEEDLEGSYNFEKRLQEAMGGK